MKKRPLMMTALLSAMTAWATDYNVGTDDELRAAIQNDGANITVTADIELSNSTLSIAEGITVTINLNNHTLDRKLTQRGEGGGQVITIREGATLNLSNGTLKGGWGGNAGGVSNEAGTANLTDVNITGCTGDDKGGAICNFGTLTMKGGAITDNTSFDKDDPTGGGGLFNAEGATATLTDVTVTGNQAKSKGGGGICNYGTLTLDGCTITGNTCGKNGGGIYNYSTATLNMQGALNINDNIAAGNKTNNLFLKEREVVTVTGSLAGSTIGINMESGMGVFTSGYNAHNSGVDPSTIFQPEWPEVMAVTLEKNEAKLGSSLAEGDIYYIDHSGEWGSPITRKVQILHPGEYTLITPGYYEDTDLFLSGTYVVVTNDKGYKCHYDGMAYVNDNTKIILCDGAKLEVEGSIQLTNGIEFNVYGQVANTGILQNNANIMHKGETPGIGGDMDTRVNMTFHGGTIKAQGERGYAAITGGIVDSNRSQINFYEANVDATGGYGSPGIGTWVGALFMEQNNICIYGGTVKAQGGDEGGAGIGGGDDGYGSYVYVYGGEVYAYGGEDGAGIGGGWGRSGGKLCVYGGIVKAWGGGNGAGIGSGSIKVFGEDYYGGDVYIYGGEVYAYGGVDAAGIGGGEDGFGADVVISGGYVYAEGNDGGAGIGGGQDGKGWSVTITGGTVVAKAGRNETGCRAIGPGEGSDEYGNLELGDNMMVTSERKFTEAERKNACWYRTQVRVEPCDHQDAATSVKDGSTHNVDCNYCSTASEAHTFGDYGECAACGLISLADDADNNGVIAHWEGSTDKTVTLSARTLKKGDWNTLCLPFNATTSGPLAGATIKELDVEDKWIIENGQLIIDNVNGTKQTGFDSETGTLNLYFKDANSIEAGKPYIVKWGSGDDIENPVFTGVTISNTTSNVESDYVDFCGIYSPVAFTEEDKSVLYLGNDNKLYYPSQAMTINAFRAYFTVDVGGASIKEFKMYFGPEDEETSIDNVQCSMFNVQSENIYNLSGQRLSKPQKGIYIVNGKKVLY